MDETSSSLRCLINTAKKTRTFTEGVFFHTTSSCKHNEFFKKYNPKSNTNTNLIFKKKGTHNMFFYSLLLLEEHRAVTCMVRIKKKKLQMVEPVLKAKR